MIPQVELQGFVVVANRTSLLTVYLPLVSSPDPTYDRGSGDIQLIPRASLTFWREISLRQSHCRKDNL